MLLKLAPLLGLGPAPGAVREGRSSGREAVAGRPESRLQLSRRRSCSNTKASTEGGEYIKITGAVIAFYINVLFKSFPQCESPSFKKDKFTAHQFILRL